MVYVYKGLEKRSRDSGGGIQGITYEAMIKLCISFSRQYYSLSNIKSLELLKPKISN
jgi:hypothetical protein